MGGTFWDEVNHRYLFGTTENYDYSKWWSFDTNDQSRNWEVITPPVWHFAQVIRVDRKLVGPRTPRGAGVRGRRLLATHDALVYVRKGAENLRVFRLP